MRFTGLSEEELLRRVSKVLSRHSKVPTPSASRHQQVTKLDRMRNKRRMGRLAKIYDSLCGQSLSSIGTILAAPDRRDNHTVAKTAWVRFARLAEIDRFQDFQPTIEHVNPGIGNARTVFFNARAS